MANPARRRIKVALAQQIGDIGAIVEGQMSEFHALAKQLTGAFHAMAEGSPPQIEELTMTDVIGFFVEHRTAVPAAEAGAILREQESAGALTRPKLPEVPEYMVHLFFLDENGRPLIGARQPARAYLVQRFDDELADAFGTNNIVIFN